MNTHLKKTKLDNGLRVIFRERKDSNVFSIMFSVRAGARYENKNQRGYAHILEHMLLKGTKKRPSVFDISVITDRLGGYINASTGAESVSVIIQVPKDHIEIGIELMSDIIFNPLFNKKVLENEKKVIIQEIKRHRDNKFSLSWELLLKKIFKDGSNSQHALGNEKSVISSNPKKLSEYHKKFFLPQRSILVLSGQAEEKKVNDLVNKYFAKWKGKDFNKKIKERYDFPSRGHLFEKFQGAQDNLALAIPFKRRGIKEDILLDIFKIYLLIGHTSVLYQKLRHDNGLVYSIGGNNYPFFSDVNLFTINTSTTHTKKALKIIKNEIKKSYKIINKNIFSELKEQYINRTLMSTDSSMSIPYFIKSFWMSEDKIITPEEMIKIVKKLTLKEFKDTLKRFIDSPMFTVVIGEKDPLK